MIAAPIAVKYVDVRSCTIASRGRDGRVVWSLRGIKVRFEGGRTVTYPDLAALDRECEVLTCYGWRSLDASVPMPAPVKVTRYTAVVR